MSISIEPIKPRIGATVRVDRANLYEAEVARSCLEALEERGVLIFPRLGLNDEEQLAFTDRLGKRQKFADTVPGSKSAAPGIYKVTLDPAINDRPEYVLGTYFWHMDGMPVAEIPPPKATLLSARRVAPKGGQTEFASTTAAYESLSAEEKADIEKLRVVHSVYAAVQPTLFTEEEHARSRRSATERERPLVWTDAAGRKSLIIGHTADRIVGMSIPEGRALLERLMEWAAQPDFKYRHQWQEGDLVIWHNSGVLHRAIPYDRNSGRVMHRTSLAGTETIS
jgi:alpha-ketoglutarate-dependent taurine dioxygenase